MTAWRQAVAQRPRHVAVWAVAGGLLAATWPPGATPALALAAVLLLRASRLPRRLALVAAAAVLAGGALGQARLEALDRHGLGPLLEQRVAGHATLLTQPRADAAGRARALVGLRVGPAQGRVLLRLPGTAAERRIGRELAVAGRLRPPDRGARALRAHATLLAERAVPTGARRGGLAGLVDGVRDRAAAALARGLPPVDGALLQGMVLGQDAGLPQHVVDDLRAAGLAHLTAASGQNVLLLAALGLAAGALLGLPVRPRLVLVLGLVALYVPLAGAGPSIQRAGVMGAAGLAATLAGRPAARWYAVGLAAAVTLALDPRAAGDPGWQMSFAAVVALAALARPLAARLQADAGAPGPGRRVRVPRGVAEALAVAVVATLATAPVAAAHFGRTSLAAVPANVLAAPAVAPVMWLGTTAGALAQAAPALAAPVAAVAAVPVAYVRALGGAAGGLGAAEVAVPPALVVVTCATALGALGLLAAAHRCRQRAADAARDAARGGVVPDDPVPPRVPSAAARRARRAAGVAVAVA
ncbi:MAG TPA: ComEC/Rec2 family competence protein, partial [Baekduia sp.]|nr:ComEC/Rec2 family competence protein [Baekduia sp.]